MNLRFELVFPSQIIAIMYYSFPRQYLALHIYGTDIPGPSYTPVSLTSYSDYRLEPTYLSTFCILHYNYSKENYLCLLVGNL